MNLFIKIDKDFFNVLYFKFDVETIKFKNDLNINGNNVDEYNIQIELLDEHNDFYFHVENHNTETHDIYTSNDIRLLDFDNVDQDIKVYDFYKFIYYQIFKHIEKQFLLGDKK